MSETIRIGIVGAGNNTQQQHIPKMQAIEGVIVQAVCNRSMESGQKVADACKIADVYDNWQKLVCADNIDAIVIGTWPNMHHPITMAALAADKHVMCEARIARNADEALEMYQAAHAKPQLIAQVVPAPFTIATDSCIQRMLSENYIGDLLHLDVRFAGQAFLDRDAPKSWRQDTEISGNNILALGICYESIMRWCGEAASVQALGTCYVTERKNNDGAYESVSIPEHLDVIARMRNNASAHFRMSAVSGFAAENEFRLLGSNGTLIVRGEKIFGATKGEEGLSEISVPDNEKGSWRVEEEFINAIRGTEKIQLSTFEDGVRYMRFTDAVHRSLSSQKSEDVEVLKA
ncbi:MAG: Gfo/Idh/MocA family oxidoreductase [Planctomycetes bacterium]|nr:Gfo/Idh/MocA family oxidoreductase [Planctomycetota bacterium]